MDISEILEIAQTGDKLFVSGNKAIRMITGETESHVAVLLWIAGQLVVSEFVEGEGFQEKLLQDWLISYHDRELFYGQAPDLVRGHQAWLGVAAKYREIDKGYKPTWWGRLKRMFSPVGYGWVSLVKVGLSQWTGWDIGVRQRVCSTYAQEGDEACGFKYEKTADPGDIARVCVRSPIFLR